MQVTTVRRIPARQAIQARKARGFTLVEILIVVIILGILAAIVIPQFTNASEDARRNSLTSQLQTIRSQVELYKLQHRESWPTTDGTADAASSGPAARPTASASPSSSAKSGQPKNRVTCSP
jgi:general secretion pathway protein G